MPPRKSGSKSKASSSTQAQLSFQTRKPGNTPKKGKGKLSKQESSTSIDQIENAESSDAPSPTPIPTPLTATKSDNSLPPSKDDLQTNKSAKKAVERRQLDVKSKEWSGVIAHAKKEMAGMKPIHAGPDTHNDIHHVLRIFDMTSAYGPYVGITRLQRWERAKKLGLNPPAEIHDILTTQQGEDDVRYRENVLHSWLG